MSEYDILDLVKAWPFNHNEFPHYERAGNNKFHLTECPFCHKKPEEISMTTGETWSVFPFRNELSAREYRISGLCQKCQDDTFGKD